MPHHDDRTPDETDGDPRTKYEDTTPHTRSGFMPEQPDVTAFSTGKEETDRQKGSK